MVNSVSVILRHLGVDVEAGLAELRDLFGEQLYSLGAGAEYDSLVNFEFREQGIQAVQLLLLLQVGVVLRHSLEGQLVHQVDQFGVGHVVLEEALDLLGVGR
eukprot:CAMPEP_0168617940 /NCGR_PEP_ID=MMETSP0449_2-20121227/5807_1 /TAXON_ID=1082188 /ORGANISM="Strombidium rassoulzadegani, Strain ras09" /LENGTH=101 /DNA_ID=CAMNT_0008658783 /DNA_START=344 /DNA_END=649 /DNA_ORIENTATION=-